MKTILKYLSEYAFNVYNLELFGYNKSTGGLWFSNKTANELKCFLCSETKAPVNTQWIHFWHITF